VIRDWSIGNSLDAQAEVPRRHEDRQRDRVVALGRRIKASRKTQS